MAAQVCPAQNCCITVWGVGNAPTQALSQLPCSFEVLYFSNDTIVTGRCNVLVETTKLPIYRSNGCLCKTTTFTSITGDKQCDSTPVCVQGGANGQTALDIGVTNTLTETCTQVGACQCSSGPTGTPPCSYTQSNLKVGVCGTVIPLSETAGDMTMDPSGNAFVASVATATLDILKITPAGVCSKFITLPGANIEYYPSITSDSSGNIFVGTCLGTDYVYKITPAGVCSIYVPGSSAYCCIRAVTINQLNGHLIFASSNKNLVYSTDGVTLTLILDQTLALPYSFSLPDALTTDKLGNIFVACAGSSNSGSHNILRISPQGIVSQLLNDPTYSGRQQSLVTDAAGNLFAAAFADQHTDQKVYKFTVGTYVPTIVLDYTGDGVHYFAEPAGLSVDALGNLYVAGEYSQSVIKVTPAGAKIQIIDEKGLGLAELDTPTATAVDPNTGDIVVLGENSKNLFRLCSS